MKTMIRHITILMAVAMMVLLGGGCAEVNETQQTVQPKGESEAIGFDIYTQRAYTRAGTAGDVTTDGLKDGTHSGFGVIAYYTGENSYDENIVPNFMYNQKVAYNSSAFDYSPIKYWPNETNNDHISFFAYAPWVAVDATTGVTTGDQTYGIIGVSKNTFTGAPLVNYIATTDLSKGVDLCWGKQLNKQKPNDGSKVNFTLSHSLTQLNVQVKSSIALDANTKIYIRSISFSGFTMKGALNLNSTTPLWLGYDGLGRLNKDAVTIYDGRRDGREGSLADDNEGLTGLNPDFVQSTPWDDASPKPGVTNSAYNLFDNSSATTTPAYVIPTGDPVDVTIEYDIETKDDNLKGYYLSDGKTYGTSLTNRITKTNVLTSLEAGKSYTLNLNLGIQDITFNATSVSEWKSDDPELVPLTFEAMEAGATVKFKLNSDAIGLGKVQYSTDDGDTWEDYTSQYVITLSNVGDKVQFKSSNISRYATNYADSYSNFIVTGNCYVYGNILSLINFNKTLTQEACFYKLFRNCTTIKNHDSHKLLLPATTLTNSCYSNMFYNCTGLTTAPDLPATTMKSYCYTWMFYKCQLTAAPALPATTLAENCYDNMFCHCESMTSAPALPATTLAKECYYNMFEKCQSLTTAPALPATNLAKSCYKRMFYNCTGLTTAPALPATTLAENCYQEMFCLCQSLTSAPALPATTLTKECYKDMFAGCESLTAAPNLSATTLADACCYEMFKSCTNLTTVPSMPNVTTLNTNCYYKMFVSCTSLTTFPSTIPGTTAGASCCEGMFSYCYSLTTSPALPATTLQNRCYYEMFNYCTSLTTASAISATTLAEACCYKMFYKCTNLTTAAVPPATTAATQCYYQMFEECSNLVTPPNLPATTLANSCYASMFQKCVRLTSAPALPATTLAQSCYIAMFASCSSLTSAPDHRAPTLVTSCYYQMFYMCTSLNRIKCLATDISASSCTSNWLYGVASNGTFTKKSGMTSWTTGTSGIPSGWTDNDE